MLHSFFTAFTLMASIFFYSCGSNTQVSNLAANREVNTKYHEVGSNGEMTALNEIIAQDFVCHFINGIEWKVMNGATKTIASHRKSFPDWKEEIVDMISEGDRVVTRYKSTGTHLGTFNGLDSTGKKVTIYETSIYRIANGKIVEQWGLS